MVFPIALYHSGWGSTDRNEDDFFETLDPKVRFPTVARTGQITSTDGTGLAL